MNKKLIYLSGTLVIIFFIVSLIIFLKSKKRDFEDTDILQIGQEKTEQQSDGRVKQREVIYFFFREYSNHLKTVTKKIDLEEIPEELYGKFLTNLLAGQEGCIIPAPEGIKLRTLYFVRSSGMLVLDFEEQFLRDFPGGSKKEMEFIYFFVSNFCFNFKEIKRVKFLASGNEFETINGHIDTENPFFKNLQFFKN